jgi:hypothetical protein
MIQRGGQVVIHLMANVQQKTIEPFMDTGKDSGQKLTDVSHRCATGPCRPLGLGPRAVHDPHTTHFTDIMGEGVFTKPLALALV